MARNMYTVHSVTYIYVALLKLSRYRSKNLQLRWVQWRVALLCPHETRLFVGSPRPAALHLRKARISMGSPRPAALHLQKAMMSMRRSSPTIYMPQHKAVWNHCLTYIFRVWPTNMTNSFGKQVLTGPGIPWFHVNVIMGSEMCGVILTVMVGIW